MAAFTIVGTNHYVLLLWLCFFLLFKPPPPECPAPSHPQPSTSDSVGQPPTLCTLQMYLLTYLHTYYIENFSRLSGINMFDCLKWCGLLWHHYAEMASLLFGWFCWKDTIAVGSSFLPTTAVAKAKSWCVISLTSYLMLYTMISFIVNRNCCLYDRNYSVQRKSIP